MLDLNLELFKQYAQEGDVPVLVDFWAPWCGYCRRIAPALEKVAEQYEGSLIVGKVNIDDYPQLAQQAAVEVIPTLVLYRKGQALASIVGPGSKAEISAFIDKTLGW